MSTLTKWHKLYMKDGDKHVEIEIRGDLSRIAEIFGRKAIRNRSGRARALSGLIEARVLSRRPLIEEPKG